MWFMSWFKIALSMVLLVLVIFRVGWSDVSMGVVVLLMVGGVGECDCCCA